MKTLLLLMTVLAFVAAAPASAVVRAEAVVPSDEVSLATCVTSFN